MKRRTLRGLLDISELRRLIVDDGRLTHGYKVVKFVVWPYAPAGGAALNPVTLGLQYDMSPNMDAGDNRQIGWAISAYGLVGETGGLSIIDPDHVVIMDLWIRNDNTVDQVNYLVELEPIGLTNDQAILTLIKERSQDDLR